MGICYHFLSTSISVSLSIKNKPASPSLSTSAELALNNKKTSKGIPRKINFLSFYFRFPLSTVNSTYNEGRRELGRAPTQYNFQTPPPHPPKQGLSGETSLHEIEMTDSCRVTRAGLKWLT